jgi:hypothetical protein
MKNPEKLLNELGFTDGKIDYDTLAGWAALIADIKYGNFGERLRQAVVDNKDIATLDKTLDAPGVVKTGGEKPILQGDEWDQLGAAFEKKRLETKKTSIQLADHLFSKYARILRADKDGQVVCVCCGKSGHWREFDPAHFVGRSCMALRWDTDNVWPCHRVCHDSPDHLDRYEITLIKTQGEAFVDDLRQRGKRYCKAPNDEEIKEIIAELTYKLTEYANQ